jgi:hypothetical protein
MEDIIGFIVSDSKKGHGAFITWGRIISPDKALEVLSRALPTFGFSGSAKIRICDSLQEVSKYPYFFEGLFYFSARHIPYGKNYRLWSNRMEKQMNLGKEIYFIGLGKPRRAKNGHV